MACGMDFWKPRLGEYTAFVHATGYRSAQERFELHYK